MKTSFDLRSQCNCHLATCDLDLEIKKKLCVRKRLISLVIKAIKAIDVSATFGTDLWNMTKVTSEEVMFHMARKPFSLTQQVDISFPQPPIERSSELFWS